MPCAIFYSRTFHAYEQSRCPESDIPRPGKRPVVADPIFSMKRLTKVLMDGGSVINIMYFKTLDTMGIGRSHIRPSGAPFHGIVLGKQAVPIG